MNSQKLCIYCNWDEKDANQLSQFETKYKSDCKSLHPLDILTEYTPKLELNDLILKLNKQTPTFTYML